MHPNAALIHRFYDSFAALDAAGMRACYHPDVVFHDAAFGELRGAEAGAEGWSYADVAPYFERMEHWHGPAGDEQGNNNGS